VELPKQWKIHNVFHADLITPYKETELHGPNFTQPPPDLVNGEEEYEVEKTRHETERTRVQDALPNQVERVSHE
jgi:hypothetical protein